MGKFFSFLFFVGIIGAAYYYLVMPQPLPSSVIENTSKADRFYDIIGSKRNVVFWSGSSALDQDKDKEMRDLMRYNHYDRKFRYVSDWGSDNDLSCRNGSKKCMAFWMRKNCDDKFCIYLADVQKVLRISIKDQDKLLKILEEYSK